MKKYCLFVGENKGIVFAVILGGILCLIGINWGQVESWHPDKMALRIPIKRALPFKPSSYDKPPLHTYLNFFFAEVPARALRKLIGLPPCYSAPFSLIASRLFTLSLYLASIVLIYNIGMQLFGKKTSELMTMVYATSAGIIAFSHALTADIPLLTAMLATFWMCMKIIHSPNMKWYLLAGILTGLTTAIKYNGLAIGIAVFLAHVLSLPRVTFTKIFFDPKFAFSMFMVPIGFILGNPYSIIDWNTFISDFIYNYKVTPVYHGVLSGTSYFDFLMRSIEIVGLPTALLIAFALVYYVFLFIKKKLSSRQLKYSILLLSVFLLYYIKFGAFTRLETRFVLPVIPYVFLMTGFLWERIQWQKTFLFILIGYNIICSVYVGLRFLEDPRMDMYKWAQKNFKREDKVLMTSYSPGFRKRCDLLSDFTRLPSVSGRYRKFSDVFKNDENIIKVLTRKEKENDTLALPWYNVEYIRQEGYNYIALNSIFYNRFIKGNAGNLYPNIAHFFNILLKESEDRRIVYDQETKPVLKWIYPQQIDFLRNRMVVVKLGE